MANAADVLVFKLMIDGKEAIATLDLTKGEFVETGAAATAAQEKIQAAYKNLTSEALKYDAVTEANVQSLTEFIKTQSVSIDIIENTISVLQNEIKTLDVNSEGWKQKVVASTNLKAAMGQLITSHTALGGAQQSVMPGMNSMNIAMGQFGYLLSDADMFLVNYQMGLRSIGNNIPMVVQYMQYAKQEAAGLNMTVGQAFWQSIKGPGGLLLGVNAAVFGMQLLAKFMGDSTKEIKEQKEEIDKLRDSYQKLSKQQFDSKELELRTKLATQPSAISKGIPQFGIMPEQVYTTDEGKKLKGQLDLLLEVKNNMGDLEKIENRRTELQEKISKLKNIDDGVISPHKLELLKQYQVELKRLDDRIDEIRGRNESGVNSLANEKAKYEELEGKIIEIGIQKDNELSDYEKELAIILQLKTAKLESLAAEEKILETRKKKTPADEQKFANIQLEKQIAEGEADVQTEKLKKDHNDKMQDLDFQLTQQNMQLMERTNAEIIQAMIDHYQKLLTLETDAEKRKELELKIGSAEIEMMKNSKEGNKFFDEFKAKSESDPYKQQMDELKVEEDASIKRAEMFGASEEQKTNIHNYYTKQREAIDLQSRMNTLTNTSQMLGQLAGLFGKHTAAYKLLATAQVMIETYKGVMALYSPPPVGVGPVLAPFMTAAVIGTGIANVANIMKQDTTMKGYARGGAIVGENGMEIIAPAEDYATGMAELVTRTAFEVRNYFNAGSSGNDNGLMSEVRMLREDIRDLASRPSRAYFDNDEALKVGQHIDYENRTGR